MELEVKIDRIYLTPKVVIYTKEMTQEVMDLAKRVTWYTDWDIYKLYNYDCNIII